MPPWFYSSILATRTLTPPWPTASASWPIPGLPASRSCLAKRSVRSPNCCAWPRLTGADRLANASAAHARFGAPVVVGDFGTAVTFEVVDAAGNYTGGIIAPGLSAMTDYLHEKTALLPRIKIAEPESVVGKDTGGAMLSGAVHGYRGLIAELVRQLKRELGAARLPVVATGGYAALMAAKLPVIRRVEPLLTLEGLRLAGLARRPAWWRT